MFEEAVVGKRCQRLQVVAKLPTMKDFDITNEVNFQRPLRVSRRSEDVVQTDCVEPQWQNLLYFIFDLFCIGSEKRLVPGNFIVQTFFS